MRRLTFIALFLFAFIGCAKLGEVKTNITACYNDPVCYSEALAKASEAGRKAGDLAGLSGFPWAEKVAKPAVGYAVLLFSLAALGKKKREVVPA